MEKSDLSRLKIQNRENTVYKMPWGLIICLFIIVAFLASLAALLHDPTQDPPKSLNEVAHASPASESLASKPYTLNATGYVVAQRSAAVSSKAIGRLKDLMFKEGDLVKKGQVLGVLENDDLHAAVREAEAGLQNSYANERAVQAELSEAILHLNRIRELRKSSFASQADLDSATTREKKMNSQLAAAKAQIQLSEAQLARYRTELEYTFIRAPFDGTVLKKSSEIGEIVAPFGSSTNARAALGIIADMSSLQVEADVSEANLSKIFVGQDCDILLDSLPEVKYSGIVDKIVPTVDRAKATVMTKIRFNNIDEKVIPEMSAKVVFHLKDKQ
ncbi:MAG: efflux RND transporter periplasmic adaptor subunit [SAR324 cluster bacterium]|uniref:Efflux RND transporter periplasmic adaptor subunit n=1 Tax=SAR324 cluster bacterium TaxID=2024889 RepID=A0A7X9IJR3_9DELT|nr:efflux RND transporter periplasmic adaptor subunit [SAR324 cluster bacterium]